MRAPPAADRGILEIFKDELRSYPGRLDLSWRMALLCAIVTAVSMAQGIPEVALSCYLIFFASKDNAGSCIMIGIALIAGATIGIALALIFFMFSADQPFLRLVFVVLFTFGGMFMSQASRLGPIAGTVGFVFAFAITLFDYIPLPELLVQALTWMWKVVFVPMALLIVLNVLAGRKPAILMQRLMAERMEAVAVLLRDDTRAARKRLQALLGEGNESAREWEKMASRFSPLPRHELRRLGEMVACSYELMAVFSAAFEEGGRLAPRTVDRIRLAEWLEEVADVVRSTRRFHRAKLAFRPPPIQVPKGLSAPFERLVRLSNPNYRPIAEQVAAERTPFVKPDAFTNPDYVRFALKTVLAVMICYFTYTGLGWFEIHTAMITCFYVALATTAETMHKLTLRIAGCLVGAAMGVFSVLFLMPHMTDIGHLALLVGAGSLAAAWVANGSERISYMGWQMALAFFLVVLHGSGPSFDLSVASDRIIGILYGNVVVAIVFSSLWSVSAMMLVRQSLSAATQGLASLMAPARPSSNDRIALLEKIHVSTAQAARKSELLRFEFLNAHDAEETKVMRTRIDALTSLTPPTVLIAQQRAGSAPIGRAVPAFAKTAHRFELRASEWLASIAGQAARGSLEKKPCLPVATVPRMAAVTRRAPRPPAWMRAKIMARIGLWRSFERAAQRLISGTSAMTIDPTMTRKDRDAPRAMTAAARAATALCLLLVVAGCNSTALDLAPASPQTPAVQGASTARANAAEGPDFAVPADPTIPNMLARPEIDPRYAYSLPELIDIAQRTNPVTRAGWERARQAAIAVGATEATFLPVLTANVLAGYERATHPVGGFRAGLIDVPPGTLTTEGAQIIPSLAVTWLLFDFGQRQAAREAAKELSFAANVTFNGMHQKLILDVARAFFTLSASRAQLAIADDTVKDMQTVLAETEARRGRGLATTIEVAQARQAVAQAKFDRTESVAAERAAYQMLLAALGVFPTLKINVQDTSRRPLPRAVPQDLDRLIEASIQRRPDVQATFARLRAEKRGVDQAEAEFLPKIAITGNISHNIGRLSTSDSRIPGHANLDVNDTAASVLVGVSVPLFDGGLRASRLRAAQADVAAAEQELAQIQNAAAGEIVAAYELLRTSLAAYAAASELTRAAEITSDAALGRYRNGLATIAEVSVAHTALLKARLARAKAHSDALSSAASLAFTTGTLTNRMSPLR